jgi:hypothetical protein
MVVALVDFLFVLFFAALGIVLCIGVAKPHNIAEGVGAFIISAGMLVWCYGSILKAWGH